MKQTVGVLFAVITMGVFIAFLLYVIENRSPYDQTAKESNLPSRFEEEKEMLETESGEIETIKVLIKTDGFEEIYHHEVEVLSGVGLQVVTEKGTVEVGPNESIKLCEDAMIYPTSESGEITVCSVERGDGNPAYKGKLRLIKTETGIVIVNEVPLEEYICGVVPSEMPTSYEVEALKAQAVCARSYAYNQMQNLAYPEYDAHVDDSVSYQVYRNFKTKDVSDKAVRETAGEKLWYGNEVAKTYFYSTSSGHSASIEAWGSSLVDGNQYLKGVNIVDGDGNAYESELDWYRWSAIIDTDVLENIIETNTQKELGELKNIEITKRGTGNIVQQLEIIGSEDTIVVETENKIRKVLGGDGCQITKQDGSIVKDMKLLPSAFFSIEKNGNCYIISGGGYGHGIGMSQSGANELAKNGKNYKEILEFFYPGTKVK